jgi:predicted DNA-binding antitoxin AbrB/MazE fold protein
MNRLLRNLFKPKQKVDLKLTEQLFDFFKIEKTGEETLALGDFANKEFAHWLWFIHGIIQGAMDKKTFNGEKVENYVNITLYIGGQKVDVSIIKDGCKSPHELLQELKKGSEGETGNDT